MTRMIGLVPALVLGLVLTGAAPADAVATTAAPASARVPVAGATAPATAAQGVLALPLVQRLLEDRVLALTNVQRRAHGCRALRSNNALRRSSRGHTVTMALHNLMSHQVPGEARFSTRITRAGYTGWRAVAENIARGYVTPSSVVRAWMRSPGHRRNILNCKLRDLGVGVALHRGQLWWTQNFGRR